MVGTRNLRGLVGLTALLLALAGVPAAAGAQAAADDDRGRSPRGRVEPGAAIASFEGRPIDLAEDWGEAQACLVWRQGGVLECFRTPEAMDARGAALLPGRSPARSATDAVAASFSCGSPLRLYDYSYYGGRQLWFWDRGFWQNLPDYGFDDRTSSYIVGACYAYLAEHPDGGGWWYPGPMYPYAGEPVMYASWQNTITSIYVQ